MSKVISSNKVIAKNTAFLYVRMLFNLIVSLYTSRLNLQILGVEDNGIYQIVGGVVALFAFMNGSLAGATSRFLAFELAKGKDNYTRLRETFAGALNVHIIGAVIIFILGETIGLWFVLNKLNIPDGRMTAALVVYQLSIVGTMISVLQIPYNASIIAHEKMTTFAYVGMLDVVFKLIACYLLYIFPFDKLEMYGLLILFFSSIIQLIYYIYCKRNFAECTYKRIKDWSIVKPILNFSGWDLFNNFSLISKNQGINIILNIFAGVALNAAVGFANVIYGAVSGFMKNFMTTVRPPMVKSISIGDNTRFQDLVNQSGKISFCLTLLFVAPFFFCGDEIILLWLKTPPPYTVVFSKYLLLTCLIYSLFIPIRFGVDASGRNKWSSIFEAIAQISVLPFSFWLLKNGYSVLSPFILSIIAEIVKDIFSLFYLKKVIGFFNLHSFLRRTLLPCLFVFVVLYTSSQVCTSLIHVSNEYIKIIITSLITTTILVISFYFFALSSVEKKQLNNFIYKRIRRH